MLLYAPFYFCLANAAALVALWKFARGRRIERWEPTRASGVSIHAQSQGAPRVWTEAASSGRASGTSASAMTSAAASPSAGAAATRPARGRGAPKPPSVVIVGLDSATGLQSARILAAHGVPVIGVASDPRHPCCRTRACSSVLKADTASDELIDVLTRVGSRLEQRAVLVPCTDLSVLTVSRNRAELEPRLHMVLPDPEVVELLVDKAHFYDFAAREGFAVPLTFVLRSRQDAEAAAEELPFPCIVKPALKTSAWRGRSSAKGYRATNRSELLHLYDRVSAYTHALVAQEWIAGGDTDHYTCNAYFGEGSEPLVTFTSRKLRQWPPTAGEACLSVEVENDAVRDLTIRLFQRVHHRGLGYLEVKQRSGLGDYVILEPNVGRPTGRSAQAEAAGVELLYTQYCDALGWPLPNGRVQSFRGVKWIHTRRDVQSSLHRWRRGELTIGQWARSWRGPKQDALFSVTDPVPFFADLTRAAAKLARRVQRAP
jgi:predicted ATP-grasp superfamily ATP-dependent carboligase